MSEKILVTGGTGYIGAHTVVELQHSGYNVIIADNLSNSNVRILDQIAAITGIKPEFVSIDLKNETDVFTLIHTQPKISGIIHFAASKAVAESVRDPLQYYDNNICSLVNLLKSICQRKIDFVFSSSCTVYGEPDVLPVSENAPVKPAESPYGNTKQIGEEILRDVTLAGKHLLVTALRYFNPVGAHESALIGELPRGTPQNLVPLITQTAIGKRESLTVYGDDFDTPDGTCIRDFIHVVDLAKAHVAAIKRMESGQMDADYEIFNIGTGKGISVMELIHTFESVTGTKLNYTIGKRRDGDIVKIWGDVSKAETKLNWKAERDLKEMMGSAWAWEKYIHTHPL
ncbi:UDP-glucose 4-epimerase GalE [Mucilaginibacter sp. SMC90]|uniref:UDP-glucose 4-epimerase GalE n=1 Tax=Mucilaginibacter sp. SMC90 TaxID=2929803 RepID=UPI001FB431AF|nr:UDP-glucose 4-epimerase GalE [Mucilaginibacter sp. SMC90]UOE47798.1 UDP-glucose 4-epimerase GalE [Mucilaginibacter sp. SMC90]